MYSVIVFVLMGCTALQPGGPNIHHGAMFRTRWSPDLPDTLKQTSPSRNFPDPIKNKHYRAGRKRLIAAATALPNRHRDIDGYGFEDLQWMLIHASLDTCIPSDSRELVAVAKKHNAIHGMDACQTGDIVLFSHQRDTNKNGVDDDDYTGVGVIVEHRRKRLQIATRTGNDLRHVWLTPAAPDIYRYNDTEYNSFVRIPHPTDPKDARYLSGQLFSGCIDIEKIIAHCP